KTLSVSPHWKEDHIKVIKGENATVPNILRGFKWLDEMEDENDICLIYLTTHGFPILFDLPPFDEEDGMDEALATYKGFLPIENPWSWEPLANPFAIITDDEFNFLFNRLESKGIGIIVDSCHSGGFNDNWSYSKITNWANEFAGEMKGQNRVIVTSVPEEDVSYGSFFTHYLIKGLQGYGDANNDGICSLEEAFYYAKPIIEKETRMSPQIFDSYPGELLLTEVEFPPSTPEKLQGEIIGKTNKTYVYTTSSEDPEGDEIKYLINWGDGNEEWTDFYLSGEIATLSHLWNKEGTYNVIVKAVDKWGAESEWSERLVVTMAGKHVVDQRQTTQKWAFLVNNTRWCAQSFVPTIDKISKIELEVIAWKPNYTFILSIKESLDGLDMVEATAIPRVSKYWESQWLDFNFPSISVTPGKTYYIVCKSPQEGWGVAWMTGINNPYSNGNFYTSSDAGENWKKETRWSSDACFVTYG
ncbi:MAG: hypothetical protein FE048_03135, partial [Thermoplasmata archaeon]